MRRNSGGTPKARALGAELREVRDTAGYSLRELGRELETNHVKLQRYESGEIVPSSELVAAYVASLGASAQTRERLVEMARDADQPDWLSTAKSGARKELTTLIEFERTATRITDVTTGVIPGLLQTSDYARAVMQRLSSDEVETMVLMRVGRREILTTKNAPQFVAFIAESAMNEPIGGHAIMAEQLRHVVKMSDWENVAIHVLRSGATTLHPAHLGSFVLFEFPKATPIVHMEHYHSSVSLHNPGTAAAYQDAVTSLHELAMSPEASAEFIANRASELEDSAS
ncbi:helix-turn-helix domain-containing protein [Haloactinomyces albus]|uniref:Transcriptional regulator with XRE-family HTH domain n=1 Tax=Haloactinomyces albus TaxID=1352928 RepID=A0AAE3ZFJ0_9ACTN|nr:helix-turn-helix transcriptional regulator [Haloactinomyces albus]MDR7302810.1 transcriptional regulator with XRE-family HTH domain [Haloactinomyces albus]